jgi:hypothetical protein
VYVTQLLRRALLGMLVCIPRLVAAQSHPLVGAWNITMSSPPRGDGNVFTLKALVTVTLVGDSLIATIREEVPAGVPVSEERFAGAPTGGTVRMSRDFIASMGAGGERVSGKMTSTFWFDVKGDALSGERKLVVPGGRDIPAWSLAGTRAKH